jgi:2-keto-4-pentenoate hydratase/2-oxohepta-3-ene-1,7-dioic acid hydratase in catechol pathway
MKIVRAERNGEIFYAAKDGDLLRRLAEPPYERYAFTGEEIALNDVKLLLPCEPTKIVAVGLNYARHAAELNDKLVGNPVLFIKPVTTLIAHGDAIEYPAISQRVDHEAELAVVIGKTCKNVTPLEAKSCIFGYTALNDVTARDIQKQDGQWTRAKSFDTFCPVGPSIETEFDPAGKRIQSVLGGEIKQDSTFDDMLFDVPSIISFISACMTLLPGDIIATGTPEGIGPMQRGDTIEIRIEGLDTLRNSVKG